MSDNISTPEQKKEDLTTRHLRLFLIITGTLCCLQFIIVGFIGVIRGYSVQSSWPHYIVWAWVICAILMHGRGIKLWGFTVPAVMVIFIIIPMMLVDGKHYYKGSEYYRQDKYDLAINEFRKEAEPWYRRLDYNMHEDSAFFEMAGSYYRMGNYDKAREIYLLIQQRYPFWGANAAESIKSIDSGLQKVKEYDALPEDKKNDPSTLFSLALVYEYNLKSRSKAMEIYTKIVDMPIDDGYKKSAQKAIQELTK
jgi:tetratricopeptide (TPR) repeat protein